MRNVLFASALSISAGCASAGNAPATSTAADVARRTEADTRRDRAAHSERLRELQAQLALARAEADELRSHPRAGPTETVRIGGEDDAPTFFEDDDGTEWDIPSAHLPEPPPPIDEPSSVRRPVLQLYGSRSEAIPSAGDPSFAPIAGAPLLRSGSVPALRMAVAPPPYPTSLPWANRSAADDRSSDSSPLRETADGGQDAYQRALGFFRERRVAAAEQELRGLLEAYPGHRLASRARYWLAETLYVQRRYDDARLAFEQFVTTDEASTRAPDALLKIGLCHRRAGDDAAASRAFARLRTEHPQSIAARTAAQESER